MIIYKFASAIIIFSFIYTIQVSICDYHDSIQKKLKTHYVPLLQTFMMDNTNYSKFKQAYNESSLNMIEEPSYCIESDTLKLLHPDILLEDKYVVRDLDKGNLQREIIKKRMFDSIQNLSPLSKPLTKFQHRIPPQLSYFYTFKPRLQDNYQLGQGLGCMFQKLNHIPGLYTLTSKNSLIYNYAKYMYDMKNRNVSQQCIQNASYVPHTLRLNVKSECQQFFKKLTQLQNDYKNNVKIYNGPEYLLKTDEHRGEGIRLLFQSQIENITEVYQNGEKCGNITEKIVTQKYINRPFLYKGHKIEFRIYIYLASSNPLQLYVYKRALIKRCANEYDPLSEQIPAHICNTAVTEKTHKNQTNQGDGNFEQEDEEMFIDWNLEGIEELLIEQGRISKKKRWLQDYLYPRIYSKIIHTIRSGQYSFYQDSRFSEFLAIDFLLDNELDIWLLEINYNPQILSVTPDRIKRNYKMVEDTMEIAFAYLKSKYKRIKQFIQQELYNYKHSGNRIRQVDFKNKFGNKFHQLLEDTSIDQQFSISSDNLYTHIIDESKNGKDKYFNLIEDECL
ncbi:unnamed protein product [Paramecium pentaurelia]|uniref:Tubulin-tyrosine ligase family protein n=1 Tax=Paramecium pentaurelia TaxID=43138 RepID=A0A8S1RXQ9_9CILI|nr:unnamed protein product [Paramecium pentaurelia]